MSSTRPARARNAVDIVEAGYALDGTDSEWLARVLEAAAPDVGFGCGSYAFTCRLSRKRIELGQGYAERALDPRFSAIIGELNQSVPDAFFGLLSRSAVHCGSFLSLTRQVEAVSAHFERAGGPLGIRDAFSLFIQDGEGHGLNLTVPSERVLSLSPRVIGVWRRVAVHLASGMRLRRHLSAVGEAARAATFEPSGAVAEARGGLRTDRSAREVLSRAVQRMERARTSRERRNPAQAFELWKGLVAGEWSLVDHWERDGRRYLAAYRNRPQVRDPRALTPHERIVFHYASLGESNKEIAFTLGLSLGSVASAVSQLLRKLGCARRSDLLAFAELAEARHIQLSGGGEALRVLSIAHTVDGAAAAGLSHAERAIAERLIAGETHAAIARGRATSPHTVANQVRRIFEKLGVRSRTGLVKALVTRRR